MGIEEIKNIIKDLSVDERRKVALYILELEKEHVQKTIGPQMAEGVDAVSKVVQESLERLKKLINKS